MIYRLSPLALALGCAPACAAPRGDGGATEQSALPAALAVVHPPPAISALLPTSRSVSSSPPPAPAPTTGCPAGMAAVDRFCVDRHEGHLVSRGPLGEIQPHPYFERPADGVAYEARSEPGVFPQAYISRVDSEAACANVGKRLCTRREWQHACMGLARTLYPYGPRWQSKRCNSEKPHLLTLRFGPDPRQWHYATFNAPSLVQEPGFLAKTGDHEGCVGQTGVYDLVGNLHEWVSDTADSAFESRLATEGVIRSFQVWTPGNAVFMGGFFSTRGELGPGCTFTTYAHDASYHDYSTGFRCCAAPL